MRFLALTLVAAAVMFGSALPARAADPETSFLRLNGYQGVAEQVLTPADNRVLFGTVGNFNSQPDLFISYVDLNTFDRWQITLVPANGTPLAPGTYVAGGFGDFFSGRPVMQVLHFGGSGSFDCQSGTFTIHSLDGPQLFDVSWTQICEGRAVSGRAVFRQPPDLEAPRIFVPDPIVIASQVPEGATVGYEVRVIDDIDPHPALVCTPAAGSLFPLGLSTVTCTATDAAGRTSTASFTVYVLSAAEMLAGLHNYVQAIVADPYKHVLSVTLTRAEQELGAGRTQNACNSLRTFELQVRAQEDRIPPAPDLIYAAEHLRFLLSC
jgi:hypothetical protein